MAAYTCFICGGGEFGAGAPHYHRCAACGHETLTTHEQQTYMLNAPLDRSDATRPTFLDRFQSAVLDKCTGATARRHLVDLGSGQGKFLLLNRAKFQRVTGIEITPAAVDFSRDQLGLSIVTNVRDVEGEIDVVTAWHSLEHIPAESLEDTLRELTRRAAPDARFIVSVPNASSFQAGIFEGHFAFHDVPNHQHQFSPDSLMRLATRHGWSRTATITSWPYNVFGYAQGLLNLGLGDHNYLYYRLKRGAPRVSLARDLVHLALAPLAVAVAVVLACGDALFPARQAVLTWCFRKTALPA